MQRVGVVHRVLHVLERHTRAQQLRSLVIAAALAVDTALKQDGNWRHPAGSVEFIHASASRRVIVAMERNYRCVETTIPNFHATIHDVDRR